MKDFTSRRADSYSLAMFHLAQEFDFSKTVSFWNMIDLSRIETIRRSSKVKPTYTAFIAQAIAIAMKEFPYANRRFYRPLGFLPLRIQQFEKVDIAVASESSEADNVAYIDVMRDVENKSLSEISNWLYNFRDAENNEQWKNFKFIITKIPSLLGRWILRAPLYSSKLWARYRGGAVLISSPAKYGVDGVVTCWPHPIGISFGFVKDRVIAENGRAVVRPTFNLTLNFDRRLMAGAQAAKFFNRVTEILENWPREQNSFVEEMRN